MTNFKVLSSATRKDENGIVWTKFILSTYEWKPALEMVMDVPHEPKHAATLRGLTDAFEANELIELELPYKGEDLL